MGREDRQEIIPLLIIKVSRKLLPPQNNIHYYDSYEFFSLIWALLSFLISVTVEKEKGLVYWNPSHQLLRTHFVVNILLWFRLEIDLAPQTKTVYTLYRQLCIVFVGMHERPRSMEAQELMREKKTQKRAIPSQYVVKSSNIQNVRFRMNLNV